jgi:hypothetical protein
MYICTLLSRKLQESSRIYIYKCVYIYAYIHIYIFIYIHTYICTILSRKLQESDEAYEEDGDGVYDSDNRASQMSVDGDRRPSTVEMDGSKRQNGEKAGNDDISAMDLEGKEELDIGMSESELVVNDDTVRYWSDYMKVS